MSPAYGENFFPTVPLNSTDVPQDPGSTAVARLISDSDNGCAASVGLEPKDLISTVRDF